MSLGASVGAACSAVLLEVGNKHRSSIFPGNFAPRSTCVVQAENVAFFPKLVQDYQGALLLLTNPHLNSHHGISCSSLAETGCKGTLGEGSKSDQKGSAVGLCGIWDLYVNFTVTK